MCSRLILLLMLTASSLLTYSQGVGKDWWDQVRKTLSDATPAVDRMHIYFIEAQYHIFKSGEKEIDLDSAQQAMRKIAILNIKQKSQDADHLQVLVNSLLAKERRQNKKGKELADKAAALLKNAKNQYYAGVAYFSLSDYYNYANPVENKEKRRLVDLAVQAFHRAGYIEQEAYSLKFLADLFSVDDLREQAIEKLDLSLKLYQSINFTNLHGVYILYSNVYFTDGNYKQALNYGLMALTSTIRAGDNSMTLCQVNNYIGIILGRLQDHEKAIGYFEAALKVAEDHKDNDAVLQVMANIVESYIASGKPDEALAFMRKLPKKLLEPEDDESYIYTPLSYLRIYNALKKYAAVKYYSSQILRLIKKHRPSDKQLHQFYTIFIGFHLQTKQYELANAYTGTIDSLGRKIGDPHRIKEGYLLRFRLDTALGHYKSATENLLKYQSLHDTLLTETKNREVKQLEVEYETEKNKNNLVVLNQKYQLQQNSLDRAELVKKFTFGGIGLLFIIMGLLYRQYRHKQQTNEVITHKNEQLQHLLTEKDWLVKEIHHRVKNNFHIVASLLEIQSSYLKNTEAISAIKESQHRIHSMSIIHQKLYQSETLSTIHMPEYIYELVEYLRESYSIRDNIAFSLQIDNVALNHAAAITLGLMLNEAITNSIKYAFPKTGDGKISISLTHISGSQLLLSIDDNGRGLPADYESKIGASMGMELLQGLTDDLGGSLTIETNGGTHIKVIFNHKPVNAANVSFS
ncbi:MAG: tetratricopeptide repeat protein [Chitinophagaceae bacterium]|nr:MAG: tetratricopeptide repeat protein [Chitinophagaceae bacterium]